MLFNEIENVCVCMCVCAIRVCVTEKETSSKKLFFTQVRGFHLSPFQKAEYSPPERERKGRSNHFFIFWEKYVQLPGTFFLLLSFWARIWAGAVQYPLYFQIQLHSSGRRWKDVNLFPRQSHLLKCLFIYALKRLNLELHGTCTLCSSLPMVPKCSQQWHSLPP